MPLIQRPCYRTGEEKSYTVSLSASTFQRYKTSKQLQCIADQLTPTNSFFGVWHSRPNRLCCQDISLAMPQSANSEISSAHNISRGNNRLIKLTHPLPVEQRDHWTLRPAAEILPVIFRCQWHWLRCRTNCLQSYAPSDTENNRRTSTSLVPRLCLTFSNNSSTHTHTHPFNGPFSGNTRVSRYHKGKPIWILLKQETVSGSGICWAICKSAPCSRQITTPAPHHSVFIRRMPFLPPNQQHQSTEGKSTEGNTLVPPGSGYQNDHTRIHQQNMWYFFYRFQTQGLQW